MQMLNPHCGIERDSRGVVRLTICNAGPLNILGSEAIQAVRQGLEALASDRQIRALVLAGPFPLLRGLHVDLDAGRVEVQALFDGGAFGRVIARQPVQPGVERGFQFSGKVRSGHLSLVMPRQGEAASIP